MEITYDKDADAMYIELRQGNFEKNKIIDDLTIVDLDENDTILGIEILDVSKRIPDLLVNVKNLKIKAK